MPKSQQNAPDDHEQASDWSTDLEGNASDENASDSGESTRSTPPPTPKKAKKEKKEKKAPRPDASPYKKKAKAPKPAKEAAPSENTPAPEPKAPKPAKEAAPAKPVLFQECGMAEDGSRDLSAEEEATTYTEHVKTTLMDALLKQLAKGASDKPAAKGDVGKYNGRAGRPLLSPGARKIVRKHHEALSTPFGRVSDAVTNFNLCKTGYTARLGLEHTATPGH